MIPEGVTGIGICAFEGCTSLTSITIPESVTSIRAWAFKDCTGLTSVTIPESVTKIWGYTFKGCTGLTSVTIPESVREIGDSVFEGCTSLNNPTINLCVNRRLADGLTKMNLDVTDEVLAHLYLNQRSKAWQFYLHDIAAAKDPGEVFEHIYRLLAGEKKVNKTQVMCMCQFIEKYTDALTDEAVKKMMALMESKK